MSNYDMDEIERTKSQKQKEQLGFGRDDQNNIKNILREAPKPVQQWDAQTQSYVSIGDQVDTHVKEMTRDPLGYAFRNDPKSTLPPGLKDVADLQTKEEQITKPKHYQGLGITPLDYITANELDFIEGNIIKYVSRYQFKGGLNDLLKAQTYLEKLIEKERMKNEK
jgi:hypothetical protein